MFFNEYIEYMFIFLYC